MSNPAPAPKKSKNPLRSKTIVFGVLQLIGGVALLLVDNDLIKQHPQVVAIATQVSGVVTIALRFLTNAPIRWEE